MVTPCACRIIGTRRTMPSRSGSMVSRPRPAAVASRTGMLRCTPGNLSRKRLGSSPSVAKAVCGSDLSNFGFMFAERSAAEDHARAPHRIGKYLVVAGKVAQLGPRRLVEIPHRLGRGAGIEPVGLEEHHVEGDHDRAKVGQVEDHVREVRSRPRPLAEFRQALFVDVDDGDRPGGLHARLDALEGVEDPDPQFLDRRVVGDAQRPEPDQEHETHQPCIAELPREPASPDPEPLHAVRLSRCGGLITSTLRLFPTSDQESLPPLPG